MYLFIVNRYAGRGKGKKKWQDLEQLINAKQIPYQKIFTKYKGHAEEILKQMKEIEKYQTVVVVGGDGTLQEVVNGLINNTNILQQKNSVLIGVIPAGTGNDFARSLRIPLQADQALTHILERKTTKEIDIGRITKTDNQRYFVNAVGIGFDGDVAWYANNSLLKKLLGKFIYTYAVLKLIFSYKPHKLTIKIDGKEQTYTKVWMIVTANLQFYGGGMHICPIAMPNDQILNGCVIHGISRFNFLKVFPSVFAGKHIYNQAVTQFTAKEIVIKEKDLRMHADGESIGNSPIKISLAKERINVIL